MKRYLCCFSKPKPKPSSEPEYVNETPVEILSPLQTLFQELPLEKEKLQVLDFEIVEQVNLLRAEANKHFQEAKHHIEKNELDRAIHSLRRTRAIEERIKTLNNRHSEVVQQLEAKTRLPSRFPPHTPRIRPLPSPKVPPTLY
jgi:hypothetical protein